MSQIVNGILLGSPGPVGSPGVYIFRNAGPPATSTDPAVAKAQLGSLYLDYVNGFLYVLQSGGWTQK